MRRVAISLFLLLIVLVPLVGCGSSKREAMITFTRQALQIEAERDDLLKLWEKGWASPIVRIFFLDGRLGDLPSAPELKAQMLLLDAPPSLQSVKDSLVEVYRLEIAAAQTDAERGFMGGVRSDFWPYIDRLNVDSYVKALGAGIDPRGPWVMAQKLRRDTYASWSERLRSHGIDPAKEGFTSLVQQ